MLVQLIIIQIITFIVLIVVLRILFMRQLSAALTRLKRLHEENLIREEQLKRELEEARREKEMELAKAKAQAGLIIKEAKEKTEKMGLDIQLKAKAEAQKILESAKVELKKQESEQAGKNQERAVEISMNLLKATFTGHGQEALQRQLILELIEEIKRLDKSQFTVKTKEMKVFSAYPLASDERSNLIKILSDKVGMAVELEESIDAGVIAGLIIQIGALTIDGSIRNKLKKVVPYLKD